MTLRDICAHLANEFAAAPTPSPHLPPHPHHLNLLAGAIRPKRGLGQEQRRKAATESVRELITLLAEEPTFRTALHSYLCNLLNFSHHLALYAESGIQSEQGFFSEAWQKTTEFILPPVHDAASLRGLVNIVFHETNDYLWFEQIPDEVLAELLMTLGFATPEVETDVRTGSYNKLLDAMLVLSHKIVGMAMEPDVLNRLPAPRRVHSGDAAFNPFEESAAMKGLAFLEQHREIVRYIERIRASGAQPTDDTNADNHAIVMLHQCEEALDYIRRTRDRTGTSLHLTYQMQRIGQHIRRLQTLLALTRKPLHHNPSKLALEMVRFWKEVVQAENTRHSLSAHFSDNTELLALQMAENAAKTGEHYITVTRPEFYAFFRSSLGGGFIVAFLACFKLSVSYGHFPPLIEAIGYSLNYAFGFILIHLFGFKLATKQPAMTASAIAESLDVRRVHTTVRQTEEGLQNLVRTIARTSRSQLISFAGNLALAFPMAILLAFGVQYLTGSPIAIPSKAHKMLAELHPFHSLSLLYAAIAGVFLFTSGFISGYYDNQVVFHRIPERIRRHPVLRRLFKPAYRERFAHYVEHNLGALAGNFFLGCMLGTAGLIGFLTGLPIDIRHITFAAANASLAVVSLNFAVSWQDIGILLLGIFGIGVMNFAVSFGLALLVAMRSRKINFREGRQFLRLLGRYFRTNTREFFLPPRPASTQTPTA